MAKKKFEYKMEKKKCFDGAEVEVIGPSDEKGKPKEPEAWRKKMRNRAEMLKYLETGERYWFSDEWFGSEKRKNPA